MHRLRDEQDIIDPVRARAAEVLRAIEPSATPAGMKEEVRASLDDGTAAMRSEQWSRLSLPAVAALAIVLLAATVAAATWAGARFQRRVAPIEPRPAFTPLRVPSTQNAATPVAPPPPTPAPASVPVLDDRALPSEARFSHAANGVRTTVLVQPAAPNLAPTVRSGDTGEADEDPKGSGPAAGQVPNAVPPILSGAPVAPALEEDVPSTIITRQSSLAASGPTRAALAAGSDAHLVFEAARALRTAHDPLRASALLQTYLHLNPDGSLAEEALALSVEAAAATNDRRAGSLAADYLRRYPGGAFSTAARRAIQRFETR